jgi:RimJ/RimL family protein N-acetyltransferase
VQHNSFCSRNKNTRLAKGASVFILSAPIELVLKSTSHETKIAGADTMIPIPTLETPRLTLRAHRLEDFETYAALWGNEDVVRFIGGSPSTPEHTWARLLRAAGHWHHFGFGFLIIEEKQSRRVIGEAGFHEAKRDMKPSIEGTLETGWLLSPDQHGKGYALEALQALIAWGEQSFPAMTMTAIINPENQLSLKLAAKLGFQEFARSEYHGEVIVLSRPGTQPA